APLMKTLLSPFLRQPQPPWIHGGPPLYPPQACQPWVFPPLWRPLQLLALHSGILWLLGRFHSLPSGISHRTPPWTPCLLVLQGPVPSCSSRGAGVLGRIPCLFQGPRLQGSLWVHLISSHGPFLFPLK